MTKLNVLASPAAKATHDSGKVRIGAGWGRILPTSAPRVRAATAIAIAASVAACSTMGATPTARFNAFVAASQPYVAVVEAEAKTAMASGLVPAKDMAVAQTAVAALDAANAELKNPAANEKQVAMDVLNAVNGVVQVIPSLPADAKLGSAFVTAAVAAFMAVP